VPCKVFRLGINLEFISIAAAMCITLKEVTNTDYKEINILKIPE